MVAQSVSATQASASLTTASQAGFTPDVSSTAAITSGEAQLSSQAKTTNVSPSDEIPNQELILKVNDSSVKRASVDGGRVRLEAIRSALNELDAQATIRSQVAAFHETPKPQVSGQATMASTVVRRQAEGLKQSNQVPIQAHKARAQDSTVGKTNPEAVSASPLDTVREEPPRELSYRPLETQGDALRRTSAQQVKTQAPQVQTSADFTASQTGSVNAEISSDQDTMTQVAKVDAEHIEAGEVPELPVADPSQLDIDVDDPAGTVRVTMTKEAEEVTVRMETPQQVLEEYQDMESDLEKALAMQGLNLADFDATGQGAEQDEESRQAADQSDNNSSPREVDPGVQELEQTGDTAQLVNRIV